MINYYDCYNYHDYIDKIFNDSKNAKVARYFSTSVYFAKVTKVFKNTIIHSINKSQYSMGPSLTLIWLWRTIQTHGILIFY